MGVGLNIFWSLGASCYVQGFVEQFSQDMLEVIGYTALTIVLIESEFSIAISPISLFVLLIIIIFLHI